MNRTPFYLAAIVLHLAVLFWVNLPESQTLPLKDEKKYLEVTLSSEPGPAKPGPDSGPSDRPKSAANPGPIVEDSPPPVATITPEPVPPPPDPVPPPEILPPRPPPPPVPEIPTPPVVEQPPPVEAPPFPAPPPPPVPQAVTAASAVPLSTAVSSSPSSTTTSQISGAPVSGTGKGNAAQWSLGSGGNGHFYRAFAVPNGISWPDANRYAKEHGGYLATIESAAENEYVFKLVDDPKYWLSNTGYGNNLGPWLGGVRAANTSNPAAGWTWVNSGHPFTYTNWSPHQPDNDEGIEDRLEFYHNDPSVRAPTWNDVGGDRFLHGFIVEFDTEAAYLASHPEIDPFARPAPRSTPFKK